MYWMLLVGVAIIVVALAALALLFLVLAEMAAGDH